MNGADLAHKFELEKRWREQGEINAQTLQHAPGNYPLQAFLVQQLFQRVGPRVLDILVGANVVVVRCVECGEPTLVVVYRDEARICHVANLDHLDTLCTVANHLLGVRKFAVRGSDLLWKITRTEEGGWLKHCVEGV